MARKKKTNEEFVGDVRDLVGDEYMFLEEYINSKTNIKCIHNKCGHIYSVRPTNFLFGKGCPKCASNVQKTHEEFVKEVYNLIGDEYEFLEEYRGANVNIKCKHTLCGHEWDVRPSKFLNDSSTRCPICVAKSRRKTNRQFMQEVYDLVGSEYEFLEQYISSSNKLKCKHSLEGCEYEWYIAPNGFLRGSRCPKCAGNYRKTNKEFVQEVYELVGNEYLFLEEYIDAKTKLKCRHTKCGHDWEITPGNFLRRKRCPQCSESQGEEKVRLYLERKDIKHKQEYYFDDLLGINDGLLRFDFAIFNENNKLNMLIEYDGVFHFEQVYDSHDFNTQKNHDKRKNQYCKDNNIPLLRIPYWDFNNIEQILEEWLHKHGVALSPNIKEIA